MRHCGLVLLLLLGTSGCASVAPAIPADGQPAAKPLDACFSTYSSFIVEGRFMVLPVSLDSDNAFDISSSLSKGCREDLDLEVVDLQTGEHHRVFGKPVALDSWRLSFGDRDGAGLRFPGLLLLQARTQDANGDGKLGWHDPVYLYGYDLAKHELFSILPEKTTLLKVEQVGDALVLILGTSDKRVSIYTYTPSMRQGRFVVEGLVP